MILLNSEIINVCRENRAKQLVLIKTSANTISCIFKDEHSTILASQSMRLHEDSSVIFSAQEFNHIQDVLLLNQSICSYVVEGFELSLRQIVFLNHLVSRNQSLNDYSSLLHYAACHGDILLVQACVWTAPHAQALMSRCPQGKTPLEHAKDNQFDHIVSFLNQAFQPLPIQLNEAQYPLSEDNIKHICDSLRIYSRINPTTFKQKLIKAAQDGCIFPVPAFEQLVSAQKCLSDFKDEPENRALIEQLIVNYFTETRVEQFIELLNQVPSHYFWNPQLLQHLAGSDIIIHTQPYVEATIKNGKIYWNLIVDHQFYAIRESHRTLVEDAMARHQSWRLTWKQFRVFKNGGKRIGNVEITQMRFVEELQKSRIAQESASRIWRELCEQGVLTKNYRLSNAWAALSAETVSLKSVLNNEWYPLIAQALENISNNPRHAEIMPFQLPIYRPSLVTKKWFKSKRVCNNLEQKNYYATRPWDVSVHSDLSAYTLPNLSTPYIIDHIPSKSQIKSYCLDRIAQCKRNIELYRSTSHNLRQMPHEIIRLEQQKTDFENEYEILKKDNKGSNLWCINITKELDDLGDTTRTPQQRQKALSFFTSIKKHLDDLKKFMNEGKFSIEEYLLALGAFRYMYSRFCKKIKNVQNTQSIHPISYHFFGLPEQAERRAEIDQFFIEEMQNYQRNFL